VAVNSYPARGRRLHQMGMSLVCWLRALIHHRSR
jgi:hypothetical protein